MTERPGASSIAAAALLRSDIFSQIDPAVIAALSPGLDLIRLRAGETLMRAGDSGDCMYVVVSGRLHAWAPAPEGEDRFIGTIGSGECVGEMALLAREPRSTTVRAARDTELVQVSAAAFRRLAAEHPDALMRITAIIVARLRRLITAPGPASPLQTLALLPLGTGVPLSAVADQLTRALGAHGRALRLDAAVASDLLASGTTLEHQEASHRFVVYEADHAVTPWTERCVREADRILLIAQATSSTELGEMDELIRRIRTVEGKPLADRDLVLLHERRDRAPVDTEQWLTKRDVVRHYHICLDHGPDLERLARMLSGTPIGLVLGGGGARGFAHIGVIRALAEAGIPVDVVCGVSMGAILAAHCAMGFDYEAILRMARKDIAQNKFKRDVTVPVVSLNSGRRFRSALRSFYGETRIEDLWLNYFAVSCNLSRGEVVTHQRGSLWRAVNASNAIPGVLPPALQRGDLLVDGGIVNNLPGDILRGLWGGPLVVVNVSPSTELTVDASWDEMPSPWKVLWHRISPFHKRLSVPAISSVMIRTLMVGSRRKAEDVKAIADCYLQPPLDHFRMDDYLKIDEIVDVGYQHAKKRIASWADSRRAAP